MAGTVHCHPLGDDWGSDQALSQTRWSQVKKPSGEEIIPTSRSPWVARIAASAPCSRELSTYYTAAAPRMLFSHWYTSPTPLVEGAGNLSRSAATTAMFWLALAKAEGCHCTCSFNTVWPPYNAASH
jgi:hypothetical protein